ncbi:ubiquitin-conjugating enzyme E2 T-like [Episyrphus balteatus]|uniref:ubiquitin-conjugating enzyme E2 T-like n=1 Tax=Episyrphus balteatus TaxID=286459 RepID=UPI0024869DCB|nr:ubiquitin-conjugating enzyme E2 T-like [Episyrphus balteatus]
MYSKIKSNRIPVELQQIEKTQDAHGISCIPKTDSDFSSLIATIPGPKDSPYASGMFELSIIVGDQYPFRPPTFKFITPVFHPNIDSSGQICLDLLKMPPVGTYNPAIRLESILLSIQLLLANPNPDDPLQGDAADLYKSNLEMFNQKARDYTYLHAVKKDSEEEVPSKKQKLSQ